MKRLLCISIIALLPGCALLKRRAVEAAHVAADCIENSGGWEEYAACTGIDEADDAARAVWQEARKVLK